MGLETYKKTKTIRIGSTLSLLLGIIAFLIAIFEVGWGCLLIIPLYILGLLGSVLGIVPFIGPVLYYFGVDWLFNSITGSLGLEMPISTGIIFYSNLVFSIIYCFVTTSLLIIALALGRKFKVAWRKDLGKKNQST